MVCARKRGGGRCLPGNRTPETSKTDDKMPKIKDPNDNGEDEQEEGEEDEEEDETEEDL